MNRAGWLGAVLVFAATEALYALLLGWGSPPAPGENLFSYALTMAVLTAPAGAAGALLWATWWRRTGVRVAAMDAPARLLAAAVATLPADRRDWGSAMTAELAQVPDRRERRRFATGCARAALFPPSGHRAPLLAVVALAATAVVITGPAVDRALPELRAFAVTFVALVGAFATLAASRARRLHWPAPGLPTALIALAGVAASIGVTGYYLATDASVALDTPAAITMGVLLAVGLWLALLPPRGLNISRRARRTGLGVGVAVAGGLFLSGRINDIDAGQSIGLYVLVVPALVLFWASFIVAMADRSFRAGLQTAVSAVVLACLLSFAVYVIEAVRYVRAGVHPIDGDALGPVAMQLHGAIGWVLVYLPASALPFAIIGAFAGSVARMPPRPAA
jgi:hypothetical protein